MQSFVRRLCVSAAAALSLLALGTAAFLTAAVLSEYDRSLHHFVSGQPFFPLSVILCLLGAAAAIGLSLTLRIKKLSVSPTDSAPSQFAAALVGFLLLFTFILTIPSAQTWTERIRLAVTALSAFPFLMSSQRTASLTPIRALLSLFPIVYAFLSVLDIYFDASTGMNAPLKSYYLMMYLSMALFFTAEARMILGRFRTPSYCLFGSLCLLLGGSVGLSHILLALQGTALPLSLTDSLPAAASAVYAAFRLFSLRFSGESPADGEQ